MKHYFQLQYKMLNRHLIDFGIMPALAYLLGVVGFFYGSDVLFSKSEFAVYGYVLASLSTIVKLSEKHRNDFLKLSFTSKKYKKIRVVENLVLVTPFVLFLIYKQFFLFGLILAGTAILLSFLILKIDSNFTIPTPFKKYPFEFTEGFRKTFLLFLLTYFLTIIGIKVDNFNLAIFSLLVIFIISISYYSKTEKSFFVWLHIQTPKEFLYLKIRRAFINVSWLTLPVLILLSVFFTSKIIILIAFQLIGYVYLAQFILAKYSDFPKQMNLPTILVFMLSVSFPPFVFVTFWHFNKQAIQKLNSVLHD